MSFDIGPIPHLFALLRAPSAFGFCQYPVLFPGVLHFTYITPYRLASPGFCTAKWRSDSGPGLCKIWRHRRRTPTSLPPRRRTCSVRCVSTVPLLSVLNSKSSNWRKRRMIRKARAMMGQRLLRGSRARREVRAELGDRGGNHVLVSVGHGGSCDNDAYYSIRPGVQTSKNEVRITSW